ncbi:F-box and leucine-rich repeat protein 15 [Cricetulus griseus]
MRKRRGANKGAGEEARGRRWCAPTYIFAEILPGYPFPKQAEKERKQPPSPNFTLFCSSGAGWLLPPCYIERRARRFQAEARRAYCARAVDSDGATNGAVRRGARTGSRQVGPQIPRAALARLLRDAEGLQELALAPCHEWLSDEDLVPVLARNPQLRSVALAGCGQLSRRALGALAEGCPRLQRLSLAHCDWVDGLALRGLADRCPALEELDLTACRQLKDEAIVYLAQRRGAGLRSLSLAVNANVGDTAVQELARNCPQLEHLDLTGCLRVGSDGVRCLGMGTLAEYCPALRSLRVRHCHHVAEPSLSRLRKRGVDIDVEPPLHQALVLLQDMAGFAPFVNLQV